VREPPPPPVTLSDGVVTLRPPGEDDLADWARAGRDEEILRWTEVTPETTADSVREFLQTATMTPFVIEAGGFAGAIDVRPGGELGYMLLAGARGKGVMTRAVRLLAGHTLAHLPRVTAKVHPDNTASARVLQRAGLTQAGALPERDVYVRLP
jgi:RimJ/RimL family protein N-acetyltransferase